MRRGAEAAFADGEFGAVLGAEASPDANKSPATQGVKHLYDEVLRRFPEVASYVWEGYEELPYLVVGYIADWLLTVAKPDLAPSVVERVVDFDRWCMEHPRGETAAYDVMTIEVVALREKLFEHDELLPLIPHLMSHEELLENRDYLVTWVGADRYNAALRLTREFRKTNRRNGRARPRDPPRSKGTRRPAGH